MSYINDCLEAEQSGVSAGSYWFSLEYRFEDGFHICTSPNLPGFRVADNDYLLTEESICRAIEEYMAIYRREMYRVTLLSVLPPDQPEVFH